MGIEATFAGDLLKEIFNATAIANIADNAATSPLTNLYVSLHTANPAGGNQTTSEAAYTSYARVAVVRTSSGWTVTSNSVAPAANITFPTGTGGTGTATYWAIGTSSTGTGKLLLSGALGASVVMGNTIAPKIIAGSSSISLA